MDPSASEDVSMSRELVDAWRDIPSAKKRKGAGELNMRRLTLAEAPTQISILDKMLDWFALPYGHETGFYFKGRRTYTWQACGFCTMISIIFAIVLFFVLFWPVLSGSVVYSDLKMDSFRVPPNPYIPFALSRLYGRKATRPVPTLDLDEFVQQFRQIEIHGADLCTTKAGEPLFTCSLNGESRQILKQKGCRVKPAWNIDNEDYKYRKQAVISLESALEPGTKVPLDIASAKLTCSVRFDQTATQGDMVVQLQSFMNFDFDEKTGHITRHARESGDERIINAMKIEKGKPASKMYIHVQELSQNKVSANGDIVKVDELYYAGSS